MCECKEGRTDGGKKLSPRSPRNGLELLAERILSLLACSCASVATPFHVMLGISRKTISTLSWNRLINRQVRSKATKPSLLPELIVRPSATKHGLCGLDIYAPRDIAAMTKAALTECGQKVSHLQQYHQLSPSEVCLPSYTRFLHRVICQYWC